MNDYNIVKFADAFHFNDQCQTVSRQQLTKSDQNENQIRIS